jgi:translation initiation factor IF-2
MMSVQPTAVISACMSLGIFASINQRLDAETIQIVAEEFGYESNTRGRLIYYFYLIF